jgi:hypothetical protein
VFMQLFLFRLCSCSCLSATSFDIVSLTATFFLNFHLSLGLTARPKRWCKLPSKIHSWPPKPMAARNTNNEWMGRNGGKT